MFISVSFTCAYFIGTGHVHVIRIKIKRIRNVILYEIKDSVIVDMRNCEKSRDDEITHAVYGIPWITCVIFSLQQDCIQTPNLHISMH